MPRREGSDAELLPQVAAFCRHLQGERRASPHTIDAYRRDLGALCAFLETREKRPPTLADVDRFALRAWLGKLVESVSALSVSRKLASVRSFYRFLEREGRVSANPAELLATPRIRRKMPSFLGV